jgi:hypothetical protein
MIRPEHPFDIRPDLRKAASTKAISVIRPNQLVRLLMCVMNFHSHRNYFRFFNIVIRVVGNPQPPCLFFL